MNQFVVTLSPEYLNTDLRVPRLKKYLVETRNSTVTEKLVQQYRSQIPGGRLRVFCVSNHDYREYRLEPKDQALPFLQLSGIIAVRKHCLSIVAESQLQIVTKYVRDDIPALLGDVELWVQSGAGTADAEQKRVVRETLNTLESQLKEVSLMVVDAQPPRRELIILNRN